MTDFSTPGDLHSSMRDALALVSAADFSADTQGGLDLRLQYTKGLLSLVQVVTLMDPDFTSWVEVGVSCLPGRPPSRPASRQPLVPKVSW